jgi:glycosyltransferase involved in cell wall biosynthesis
MSLAISPASPGIATRRLGVLHFTDSLEPSGVGQHIFLLAREQLALGYRPAVACPDTPAGRALLERCAAAGLPVHRMRVRSGEDVVDYRRLVDLLRLGSFDVFHNHCGITWEGCWGTFGAAEAGVPVVSTEHLPYFMPDPTGRDFKLSATRKLDAAIAVSHGIARTLLEARIIPRRRLHVVWNGVDPAPFRRPRDPAGRRALLDLAPDQPLVVAVGRMTAQKRHALLLDALARARRTVPRICLALAGDGPLRPKLEARAARLGLGEEVRFLGSCRDVPALLACADVLAQPSAFEGHPLAVLEGMIAGVPVVVTDTVGSNETVEHGRSGLVVPHGDPAALADALVRLLLDGDYAARLGGAARIRAEREFTAGTMTRRTAAVYRHVLSARLAPVEPAIAAG